MKRVMPALGRRLRSVLEVDDVPWRLALALAIGVFISCTPFYGIQTMLAFLIASVCRLSRAATITGAWLNLPWFAPFVYAAAVEIGTRLVPASQASAGALGMLMRRPEAFSVTRLLDIARDLSLALLVGTTVLGVAAGAVTYVVALTLLSRRRGAGRAGASDGRAA